MLILSVDSSSQAATAALICDGELLCEYTQNQKKTHSVKMLPMIEKMLSDVGVTMSEIDFFVCGIGPGSFTGLRIGVATVRGFAETLGKECVPVNSLEALSNNVSGFNGLIFSLVSARENECYCAVYENGKEIIAPCVLTIEEICQRASDKPCMFVGDGAVLNYELLRQNVKCSHFTTNRNNMISSASIGEVGYRKILEGNTSSCESLVPLYLRKSQAEREYDEKHKND